MFCKTLKFLHAVIIFSSLTSYFVDFNTTHKEALTNIKTYDNIAMQPSTWVHGIYVLKSGSNMIISLFKLSDVLRGNFTSAIKLLCNL